VNLENISLSMIMAQAQALSLTLADVTTGECADCQCSTCVTLRGIAQQVAS
jgi:hypothetical protein